MLEFRKTLALLIALDATVLAACGSDAGDDPSDAGGHAGSTDHAGADSHAGGGGADDSRGTESNEAGRASETDAGPTCGIARGRYQALYEPRSGNCGAITSANMVAIDDNITIEKYANVDVETETIVRGCSVYFAQIVRDKTTGNVQTQIQGSTLDVDEDGNVSGSVTVTRFSDGGQVMCTGEYLARLTKSSSVIGGAAK